MTLEVFRVQILGEPFLLVDENAYVEYGFYRNEYVLSRSEQNAVSIAKKRTLKKLQKLNPAFILEKPIQLTIEAVDSKMPLSRLFRNEGFCLFRTEDEDEDSEVT